MKLKLLLKYTTAEFYMSTCFAEKGILRFQYTPGNVGFYIGKKLHDDFNYLNVPFKKL